MGRETTKRMLPTIRDLPVSEEEDDQKTTPLLNIKEKIGWRGSLQQTFCTLNFDKKKIDVAR